MNILKKIIKINIILMIILISVKTNICYAMASGSVDDAYNKEVNNEEVYNKEINNEELYDEDTYIEELIDLLNFSNVDKVSKEEGIVFSEVVYKIIKGGDKKYLKVWLSEFTESIKEQFINQREQIKTIIIIAVISAFIANIQNVFVKAKVTDASFYIIILMLASVISTGFITIYKEAVEICTKMTEFMKVLLPAYFLSVTLVNRAQMMTVYYEMALFIIWIVNVIISGVLLKMSCLYMLITYINEVTGAMFGKMAELVKKCIEYSLRIIITGIIGMNVVKQMSQPVVTAKKNIVLNVIRLIPGAGNIAGGLADSINGAAVMVRNGAGLAGLLIMAAIIALPVIKIGIYIAMYMLISAIIEPVADKKIVNIISDTSSSAMLILKCIFTVLAIFVITIGLVCVSFTG